MKELITKTVREVTSASPFDYHITEMVNGIITVYGYNKSTNGNVINPTLIHLEVHNEIT